MSNLAGKPPVGQKRDKSGDKDPAYLAKVKQLPCAICAAPPPSDAHHCIHDRHGNERSPDRDAIPLCKMHHQNSPVAIHTSKQKWRDNFGPDRGYIEHTRRLVAKWFG